MCYSSIWIWYIYIYLKLDIPELELISALLVIVPVTDKLLDSVVIPDTFNDDKNVDALETNKLVKLVLFNNNVDVDCRFEMFKFE